MTFYVDEVTFINNCFNNFLWDRNWSSIPTHEIHKKLNYLLEETGKIEIFHILDSINNKTSGYSDFRL